MTYTVVYENPLLNSDSVVIADVSTDVHVSYDNNMDQFLVKSADFNYAVKRGELVGSSFKYTSEVIDKILSELSEAENYRVHISNIALNSIHLVCEGNRCLY